ncbi:FtsX-like permease family protein [Roseateles sp. BYS180W]|uniref:FtsX-like permease family protein n=1 Tax=Roseateles rivi TaxID=3299028 RepID=A0ABW7FUD6_9BURK
MSRISLASLGYAALHASALDLRVAWRQLRARPLHMVVLLLGQALGLGAVLLVAALYFDRTQVSQGVPEPDRVMLLDFQMNLPGDGGAWMVGTPYAFYEGLKTARAPLAGLSRFEVNQRRVQVQGRAQDLALALADPDLVPMFGLRALHGDARSALRQPQQLVLSAQAARALFGREDVLGQAVQLRHARQWVTLSVGAVVADLPEGHLVQAQAYISADSPASGLGEQDRSAWTWLSGRVYARLAPGVQAPQLAALAQGLLEQSPVYQHDLPPEAKADGRKGALVRALPIARIPFEGAGQRTLLQLHALAALAALVLVLSTANVLNLNSVRLLQRQREMAVRKSLGASPARLTAQFAAEALLLNVLAALLGLGLAWLLSPWLAGALKLPAPPQLGQGLGWAAAVLLALLVSSLTTALPAWQAWALRSTEALQGRQASESPLLRQVRRGLTVLQFAIALGTGTLALVVAWQNQYGLDRDIGLRTQDIYTLGLPESVSDMQRNTLTQRLAQLPSVQGLALGLSAPAGGRLDVQMSVSHQGRKAKLKLLYGEPGMLSLYGLRLLAGQPQAQAENPVVLDERALRALGFSTPQEALARGLSGMGKTYTVVAVVAAYTQEATREAVMPQMLVLMPPHWRGNERIEQLPPVLSLRTRDPAALRSGIAQLWPSVFADEPWTLEHLDEVRQHRYATDLRIGALVAGVSGLCALLAAFGLYALAQHTVQRRRLELVLRKLHGASPWQLLPTLLGEVLVLVLLAALLALPLAQWLASLYLSDFVDAIAPGPWPALAALLALLLLVGLAVVQQLLQALRLRPMALLQG